MRWLPLLAVAVLAAGLRFFRIDAQSLWYDEGISALQLTRTVSRDPARRRARYPSAALLLDAQGLGRRLRRIRARPALALGGLGRVDGRR